MNNRNFYELIPLESKQSKVLRSLKKLIVFEERSEKEKRE